MLPLSITLLSFVGCDAVKSGGVLPVHVDEIRPMGTNSYQKVTGDDLEEDRRHWDKLYSTDAYIYGKEAALFLRKNIHFLPVGRALDIAMGEGRNAVFLAKNGFQVDGVDISEVALRKAKRLAHEDHVSITTVQADLTNYFIKPDSYNVIINFDYLQRSLIPKIKRGLKRGGVVIYGNDATSQSAALYVSGSHGSRFKEDDFLEKGELKELFKDFEILLYQETVQGNEIKASMIARKPG